MSMTETRHIWRPKPRRPGKPSLLFDQHAAPQQPPSPYLLPAERETPSRAHSLLNLTSSTLLGIYTQDRDDSDNTDDEDEYPEQSSTPWGTGIEALSGRDPPVKVRRLSITSPSLRHTPPSALLLLMRTVTLFGLGMLYGVLVRHLHHDRKLVPVAVGGLIAPSHDLYHLAFWGVAGVALGTLLPWIDMAWGQTESRMDAPNSAVSPTSSTSGWDHGHGDMVADWTPVVRSVGAFVGIAYALVRD